MSSSRSSEKSLRNEITRLKSDKVHLQSRLQAAEEADVKGECDRQIHYLEQRLRHAERCHGEKFDLETAVASLRRQLAEAEQERNRLEKQILEARYPQLARPKSTRSASLGGRRSTRRRGSRKGRGTRRVQRRK